MPGATISHPERAAPSGGSRTSLDRRAMTDSLEPRHNRSRIQDHEPVNLFTNGHITRSPQALAEGPLPASGNPDNDMFDADIAKILQQLVITVPGLLLGLTVHEFMHGYAALKLGDPTAQRAGRLTFNPISHIDPVGALVLILTQRIGWAKPVPVNPQYLNDPRRDMIWIALAGPAANLMTAVIVAILFRLAYGIFSGMTLTPASLAVVKPLIHMLGIAVMINVGLAVFNLIPVPPLDGSKILKGFLPIKLAYQFEKVEPYGFLILLLLIFTDSARYIIYPPILFLQGLLLGSPAG